MTDDEEIKRVTQEVVGMFAQMTGPTADLMRAAGNARVDVLIDAYKRFEQAGWPTYLIQPVLVALAGGRAKIEKLDE